MKFGLLLGWGITLYAVMYLLWSGLLLYGLAGGILSRIVMLAALITLATLAGRALKHRKWEDILPYSIGWVVMMIVLDSIFTARIAGFEVFSDPNLWVGYLLVGAVPLLAPYTRAPHHDA